MRPKNRQFAELNLHAIDFMNPFLQTPSNRCYQLALLEFLHRVGGLTDHRVSIGSKEVVVTSHRLCPMISVNGEGGKIYLCIDKSAISLIPQRAAATA